jgi:diguanylate cyclase (GGDEF)-like protein
MLKHNLNMRAAGSAVAGMIDEDGPRSHHPAAPKLLIVDDINDNRDILGRRFKRHGFVVTEAEGGAQTLELIAREDFDLILLDVMMPDINGIEVLKRIRAQYSSASLPIIMVTGKTQSEDVVTALALGANDYITKPVDFRVALARANTQIERKRAEETVRQMNEALQRANEELEFRVIERTKELSAANQQLRMEMEQRERSQAMIRYLAHHDSLTGLANRRLLREQLCEAIASSQRYEQGLAVLFIDLDGFKGINDVLGHSTGDALLRQVANRLRDSLRDTDKIGRLGGDEFAIIQLGDRQPQGAVTLAARLIKLIELPFTVEGQELLVGASIGISVAESDGSDPEQLLKAADLAMYRAKADGRGRYRLFEPAMDQRAQARRALELDLRTALANGAFEVHYQPLINLAADRITGFEALLRWNHRDRGFVPPAEFIPLAEELGLIVPIGEWVLKQACADAATWPHDIRVAVNLSPVQFKSGSLLSAVKGALAATGLPASRLELEITESVLLEKADENVAILNELRELGIRISMDDFGTGYSSLSYFRSFPFDKIKIDQSFIHGLSEHKSSLAIVRAVSGLGRSFGTATTAEGVETEDQLRQVQAEGCTEVQGDLFSPPRPAAEIHAMLEHLHGFPVLERRCGETSTPTCAPDNIGLVPGIIDR